MFSYSFIASHLFLFPLFLSATAMTVPSPSLKNRAAHSSSLSLCLLTYLSTSHICHCNVDLGRGRKEASGSAVEADPIWTDRGCAETKPANRAGIREREGKAASLCIRRPHFSALARNCEKIMIGHARSAPLSDGWTHCDGRNWAADLCQSCSGGIKCGRGERASAGGQRICVEARLVARLKVTPSLLSG